MTAPDPLRVIAAPREPAPLGHEWAEFVGAHLDGAMVAVTTNATRWRVAAPELPGFPAHASWMQEPLTFYRYDRRPDGVARFVWDRLTRSRP